MSDDSDVVQNSGRSANPAQVARKRAGALGRGRLGTPYFSETPLPRDPAFWERRGYYLDKWYTKGSGCWEWTGTKNDDGYGTCTFMANGRVTTRGAHKLQYERYNGPVQAGMLVMHTCDNPGCVNPGHFKLGTHADNNADCRAKGRANDSGLNRSGRIPKRLAKKPPAEPAPFLQGIPTPEPPDVLSEWQKIEWRKRYA